MPGRIVFGVLQGWQHDFVHNMNDSVASTNICIYNARHIITRIAGALLMNISVSKADVATIDAVRHGGSMSTPQLVRVNNVVHSMEQQNVRQEVIVGQYGVQGSAKVGKRLVGWSKDLCLKQQSFNEHKYLEKFNEIPQLHYTRVLLTVQDPPFNASAKPACLTAVQRVEKASFPHAISALEVKEKNR